MPQTDTPSSDASGSVRPSAPPPEWAKTLAFVVVVVVLFVLLAYPSLQSTSDNGHSRTHCMANLYSVGLAIVMYQSEHDNQYPPDLDVIVAAECLEEESMYCNVARCCENVPARYIYVSPEPWPSPSVLMVAEPCAVHDGTRNVLFVNGSVQSLDEKDFRAELAKPENATFAEAFKSAGGQVGP